MKLPQFKHQRVEAELRQLVQTLPVGARLPAERSLAATYGCNFLTVRRALKELVDDGMVVRRIGSGTFVARHVPETGSASSLTERVGILVLSTGNAYASRLLQAIAHAGLEENIGVTSRWVRDFGDDGLAQAAQLQQEGCLALVLPWFPYEMVDAVKNFVQRSPLPVSLPMVIPGLERHCFMEPAKFGGATQRATEALCTYFQKQGVQRIAFLGPDDPTDAILQKALIAYACRVSRDNLPSFCGLVQPGTKAMDQLAARWRELGGDFAIISYDDEHALRFMTAMHKLGLGAPNDYRIVGFNDTEASIYSDPPLSTVPQNYDDISHWMLASALALARGQVAQSPGRMASRLIVRSTCGGQGKVDAAFRAGVPSLDIVLAGEEAVAIDPSAAQLA